MKIYTLFMMVILMSKGIKKLLRHLCISWLSMAISTNANEIWYIEMIIIRNYINFSLDLFRKLHIASSWLFRNPDNIFIILLLQVSAKSWRIWKKIPIFLTRHFPSYRKKWAGVPTRGGRRSNIVRLQKFKKNMKQNMKKVIFATSLHPKSKKWFFKNVCVFCFLKPDDVCSKVCFSS